MVSKVRLVPVPFAVLPVVSVARTVMVIVPSVSVLRLAVLTPFVLTLPVTVWVPSLKVTTAVASASKPATV